MDMVMKRDLWVGGWVKGGGGDRVPTEILITCRRQMNHKRFKYSIFTKKRKKKERKVFRGPLKISGGALEFTRWERDD